MAEISKEEPCAARDKIQQLSSLPSLAVVKYQLVKALNKEDISIEDISEIIKHDQSLASKVIAIANSAFLGQSGRINAIDQAVMLLGFDLVRSISLAASIFNVFASQYGNFKQIWAHSYVVANMSASICSRMNVHDTGSCYLAGLLHDIGRLALFKTVTESSMEPQLGGLVNLHGSELIKAENELWGCSHTQAAKWFLDNLCFPEEVIVPVENHHLLIKEGTHKEISNVIFLAEGLSDLIFPQLVHDGEWTDEHKALFAGLGLGDKDIADIKEIVTREEQAMSLFFDL